MSNSKSRLFFLDAIRAWAILMMLQGHFIDGLLDNAFRDNSNLLFNTWKYFRGITAPVFFTVSGFIFTFLLIRSKQTGWANPRVKKGIKRGFELLVIAYLLRMNIFGLFKGEIYDSFYLVDVLHCIGLSLLFIIGFYILTFAKQKWIFPTILVSTTLLLFILEPIYKASSFEFLPQVFANYLTKANGSVFTIIPWLGYATIGSFMSVLFSKYQDSKNLYNYIVPAYIATGLILIFLSSDFFLSVYDITGIQLFQAINDNNYLFIRLGDVLIVFSIFILLRKLLMNTTWLRIGQSTLSIYIIHFIILYGSFTGVGLYRFFHHSLNPYLVVPGAILFMIASTYLALKYEDHKAELKVNVRAILSSTRIYLEQFAIIAFEVLRTATEKVLRVLGLIKN
ncbi:heparan-alpha-glucosaminide N-acetyltransferase domain-containing protein [Maribacter sp. 1_MG-2023]|uniref:heparan-alpha-glucosaminide N-acetyltransferase domain-containing protein n=1 Tax=Maribacter sp. 1_MG-2023 TaxID=3062677 RepID=UPI0026E3FEE0|nr:heparan-alpha-glucosaminide N-acetyltransferase domain-containing protein [Maribacter sp. 1_MG-2023]MDO6471831.1 heparan-alpha-glucosaminide N-acetyltransferase domain-containing protein [Maribacter sp. 1_MG-2023]